MVARDPANPLDFFHLSGVPTPQDAWNLERVESVLGRVTASLAAPASFLAAGHLNMFCQNQDRETLQVCRSTATPTYP